MKRFRLLAISLVFAIALSAGCVTEPSQVFSTTKPDSYIQEEFQSVVITVQSQTPIENIVSQIKETLNSDILILSPNMLEIRHNYSQKDLEFLLKPLGITISQYQHGVSKDTGERIKSIFTSKLNQFGPKYLNVDLLPHDSQVVQYARIETAGINDKY